MSTTRPPRLGLTWAIAALAALLLLLALLLAMLDWKADELRGPISRAVSSRLGRTVRIQGHLQLHLLSLHPRVVVSRITVANAPWAPEPVMAEVGRLAAQLEVLPLLHGRLVLPNLEIQNARINLVRDATDRANWHFDSSARHPTANKPTRLPLVRRFSLQGAQLDYADALAKLQLTGTLSADDGSGRNGPAWARLSAQGEANDQPFTLAVIGQPLLGIKSGHPYSLSYAVRAANTHLTGRATIAKAFDLGAIEAQVNATGKDLADLYHLTRLALPNTSAYQLAARIRRAGTRIEVTDLNGTVGASDLRGSMLIDITGKRPMLSAVIESQSLHLDDIAPAFGTRLPGARTPAAARLASPPALAGGGSDVLAVNRPSGSGAKPHAAANAAAQLLFPDSQLDMQRIRGMDADVHFRAQSIQANKVNIKQVAFHLKLDRGDLQVDPLSFTLTQGRIAGRVQLDASRDVPAVAMDARITGVKLSQFRSKNGGPPIDGTMVARAVLHGHGASVHRVVSTADGTVTAIVPHGEIRAAFSELAGINVARGLGLLLTKDQQKAEVRCAVAQFQSVRGTLVVRTLVFDMQNVLVTGTGEIDLASEKVDLHLNGQPKRWRLVRLKSPIVVHGTLLKPAIGLDAGKTLAQGSVAAGLGALLGPVGAVLAFLDPGLAKDADCAALLNEAPKRAARLKTAAVPANTTDAGDKR